jgi:hypothetical protein
MSTIKQFGSGKKEPIKTYTEFWDWFKKHEKAFFEVVKGNDKDTIETQFFDPLEAKLDELKDGFYYLTGMADPQTAELIITVEGAVKNIVFAEELISFAPQIDGWKFTMLKPALNIEDVNIEMNGFAFNSGNMHFYSNDYTEFPDEIDITVIHADWSEENKDVIEGGIFIFLDNFLGELNLATAIDHIEIKDKVDADKELIPITKLKDYLSWREAEFVEKYEGMRRNTDEDNHSNLEAVLENGDNLLAIVNEDVLNWEGKVSHPWILSVEIKFDGSQHHGMPDEKAAQLMDLLEDDVMQQLKDYEGYLNVGRETWSGNRLISFACKDFRKPSKVMWDIQKKYAKDFPVNYDIYKDKYWQSFERFRNEL